MTLIVLNSYLNAFAASVQCDLGDGNLRYLILTAPLATYNLLSTLHFVEPTNLGPTLLIQDLAPTAVVILELVRDYAENLRLWREYNNVDRAIKMVIKTIVPKLYF